MLSFYLLTYNRDIKAQLRPFSHICFGSLNTSRQEINAPVGTTREPSCRNLEGGTILFVCDTFKVDVHFINQDGSRV